MGLNTIDTYVAWNFHEARRGEHDFAEWRDIRFVADMGEGLPAGALRDWL